MEYSKIQTLYKRDEHGKIIAGDFTYPEFKYLFHNDWICEEKIDGTNMRIELSRSSLEESKWHVSYKGRTDNANIPTGLIEAMRNTFDKVEWETILEPKENVLSITLFGEGVGPKIQGHCGQTYLDGEYGFILFDINIGGWWMPRKFIEGIANKLNIKTAPVIHESMSIQIAVQLVRQGFKSRLAPRKYNLDAEGLVLKNPYGLRMRNGERLILKIKARDFKD